MRLAHVLSPTSDDRSTEQPVDLCITQARDTQLHRHINDEPRIRLHLFLRQLGSSASYLGLCPHAVTRRQGHSCTIRNFAARRNTEQSVKSVTNVPGCRAYTPILDQCGADLLGQGQHPLAAALAGAQAELPRPPVQVVEFESGNLAGAQTEARQQLKVTTTARATRRTLPLVVLDAGHGGRDPGAIGGLDTLEKTVTLATVQELARQLRATHRYRVAFTREADYFVALNRRVAIARHSGAALLISVHADASVSRRARGASVYVRSAHHPALGAVHLPAHRGASHAIARALIAADTVLPASDPEAARLQLAMVGSLDDDLRMAADPARQARLHVLAALGIPSVLLEIGFISNPQDEVLMRQPAHRRILARAVLDAVDDFFAGRDDTARSRT